MEKEVDAPDLVIDVESKYVQGEGAFRVQDEGRAIPHVLHRAAWQRPAPVWAGLSPWDITPAAIPVPAALPLYGTGLALLSWFGYRRKRKAANSDIALGHETQPS